MRKQIWTFGIILRCLVWKIVWRGEVAERKSIFYCLKSTKLKKWDNFYSQNIQNYKTKFFYLKNFSWFCIFIAKIGKIDFWVPLNVLVTSTPSNVLVTGIFSKRRTISTSCLCLARLLQRLVKGVFPVKMFLPWKFFLPYHMWTDRKLFFFA